MATPFPPIFRFRSDSSPVAEHRCADLALNQAGPRDPITGFPIGGQAMLVFNQDLRFPMHLPLIGDRLGGAIFYDAGNVFSSIRKITFRTAPPLPYLTRVNANVCLTNCTNELNYFSHTVGFEFRYGTPIGPVAVDLGYQLNPARFLVPIGRNVSAYSDRALPDDAVPTSRLPILHQPGDDVLMRRAIFIFVGLMAAVLAACATPVPQATQTGRVVDRIVAHIEDDIILQSQVRELGAFQQLIEGHAESDDQLLSELIEQWVVQTEATASHFPQPAQSEVDRELARLTAQFRKSGGLFGQVERTWAFRRRRCGELLTRQIYVERYLDYKFRPSVQVEPADIEAYYQKELLPELAKKNQPAPAEAEVEEQIRELLVQREISDLTAKWLDETKSRLKIELTPAGAKS